jgi:hypothetical protein
LEAGQNPYRVLFMRGRVESGGTARDSKSPAAKILAMLVIVLLPLLAYVGGYFWCQKLPTSKVNAQVRCYRYRWQAAISFPAAKVETFLTGTETYVESTEEPVEVLRPFGP